MNTDSTLTVNTDDTADVQTAAPAAAPAQAPLAIQQPAQEPTQEPSSTHSTIDARLQAVTKLAEILNQNPRVEALLCSLLEVPKDDQAQPV